jgi:hypothetical protein
MADEITRAVAHGAGPAPPRVAVDGPRVRVRTVQVSPQGLPATPRKRHLPVGW